MITVEALQPADADSQRYDLLMGADKQFWLAIRRGLLIIVGAIEKELSISPTTAELRKRA